ncbi:energy transducer TonB [Sphingomonas donggukensis]|uniref:Protein TonB n=1 Tax=Sphingomonas donggukensis TaxID=2949093 RepID=A0ABY4TS53_9SPHN|nr:energy transducer TonB [Sphingomonas donggukensis]URW75221.1 energy transducer TonB [Sphingomonas donggukensis]
MIVSRYQRPKTSPGTVAAAIAVNVGMVALIATSAPTIFVTPDAPFEGYAVPPEAPPPPPIPEKPKPEAKAATRDVLPTIPDKIVEVDVAPTNTVTGTDTLQPPPGPIGPATEGTGVIVDPPAPAPVLTDAAPDPRAQFQPDYPASERRAGTEGNVTVRVLIGTDGRVKAVELVRAAAPAFFEATKRQALSRWRFRPATRDGVAVESWRTMTLRFVLEDA